MLLRGNFPPKINSYVNILWRNYLSYLFEFQLVPFAFIVILRDPFMVSPPPKKYDEWLGEGGGALFYKKCFSRGTNFVGKIYRRIVLRGGTNDQIIPREKEFHKMRFPLI